MGVKEGRGEQKVKRTTFRELVKLVIRTLDPRP